MGNTVAYNFPNEIFSSIETGENEYYLNAYEQSLYSLSPNDILPLGNNAIKTENEFDIINKYIYKDFKRKTYYRGNNNFCFSPLLFYFYDNSNVYHSKSPDNNSVYDSGCNDNVEQYCNENKINLNTTLCKTLISKKLYVLDVENGRKFIKSKLQNCEDVDLIGTPYCVFLINEVRRYDTNQNDYHILVDNHLKKIRNLVELPCAFPSFEILQLEKDLKKNKECWYKECVFGEKWKMTTNNLKKIENCKINICDIIIDNTNNKSTVLHTSCKTEYKFTNEIRKDKAVKVDLINELKTNNNSYLLILLAILGIFI